MKNPFYHIFTYFSSRKWLGLVAIVAVLVWGGLAFSSTNLEEDITKLLPSDAKSSKVNSTLLSTKLADRLIIHLSSDNRENGEELKSMCLAFVDSLEKSNVIENIESITAKVDDSNLQNLVVDITNNLPFYLSKEDYESIDQEINKASVDEKMDAAFRKLISPSGVLFKKLIPSDPLNYSSKVFSKLQSFQIDDNISIDDGFFMSKSGKDLLFFISPKSTEFNAMGGLLKEIEQTGKYIQSNHPNCSFEFFGGSAVAHANAIQIRKDVQLTISIALIGLLFLLLMYYRSWKIFVFILIPVLLGGALSLAILGSVSSSISIIAIAIGSVLLGMGIDFSLHLFTHYKLTQNTEEVLKDVSLPIILSAMTTAGAFLCLHFVRSSALHDMGNFVAFSILGTAFFSLLILPHFFKSFSTSNRPHFLDRLSRFAFEDQKWLKIGLLVLTIGSLFFMGKVEFERDMHQLSYMSKELKTANENINAISDISQNGILLMNTGATLNDALGKSENLVSKLDSLKNEGLIESYSSPNLLLTSRNNQQNKINQWNTFWTENKKSTLKELIGNKAEELGFNTNAFAPFFTNLEKNYQPVDPSEMANKMNSLLDNFIDIGKESTTVSTVVKVSLDQRKHLHNTFGNDDNTLVADKGNIVSQFIDILKADFEWLVWATLLLVFLIQLIAYGRFELAIIAILPIVVSWIITLGVMGFFNIKFNIVNIIITSFIFGLGVDYSIFVMRGLLQKFKTGEDNLPSYKTSILLSSATTLLGVGVLIFAKHPALKSIALISIIGISSVLLATMILQPLIFRWMTEKKGKKRTFPLTLRNVPKTLWVYFTIAAGSVILSAIGIVLSVMFFIPEKMKKSFYHQYIYWFSKAYIHSSFVNRVKSYNPTNEKFDKPSVIIANHKSLIDTPILFQLTPKLVIITNDWVSNSFLYKIPCQLADFYSSTEGAETLVPKLRKLTDEGYSIAIFPEGTRAKDEKILRFKKGAFLLAETLKLDIVPVYIHGTGTYLGKSKVWGRATDISILTDARIPYSEENTKKGYSAYTKEISKMFKTRYRQFRDEFETVGYFRDEVLYQYIYKGPVVQWYSYVKTKMEKNYAIFDTLIPKDAKIVDLGCGMGFLEYFLHKRSPERSFLGIDYDEEKIAIAQHNSYTENIRFKHGDITTIDFENADIILLLDVLHYLPEEQHTAILDKCLSKLNEGGKIVLRDGDKDISDRHKGTEFTEVLSTNLGFNKTQNKLEFLSGKTIEKWANKNNIRVSRIDNEKFTSNIIFVFEKK